MDWLLVGEPKGDVVRVLFTGGRHSPGNDAPAWLHVLLAMTLSSDATATPAELKKLTSVAARQRLDDNLVQSEWVAQVGKGQYQIDRRSLRWEWDDEGGLVPAIKEWAISPSDGKSYRTFDLPPDAEVVPHLKQQVRLLAGAVEADPAWERDGDHVHHRDHSTRKWWLPAPNSDFYRDADDALVDYRSRLAEYRVNPPSVIPLEHLAEDPDALDLWQGDTPIRWSAVERHDRVAVISNGDRVIEYLFHVASQDEAILPLVVDAQVIESRPADVDELVRSAIAAVVGHDRARIDRVIDAANERNVRRVWYVLEVGRGGHLKAILSDAAAQVRVSPTPGRESLEQLEDWKCRFVRFERYTEDQRDRSVSAINDEVLARRAHDDPLLRELLRSPPVCDLAIGAEDLGDDRQLASRGLMTQLLSLRCDRVIDRRGIDPVVLSRLALASADHLVNVWAELGRGAGHALVEAGILVDKGGYGDRARFEFSSDLLRQWFAARGIAAQWIGGHVPVAMASDPELQDCFPFVAPWLAQLTRELPEAERQQQLSGWASQFVKVMAGHERRAYILLSAVAQYAFGGAPVSDSDETLLEVAVSAAALHLATAPADARDVIAQLPFVARLHPEAAVLIVRLLRLTAGLDPAGVTPG